MSPSATASIEFVLFRFVSDRRCIPDGQNSFVWSIKYWKQKWRNGSGKRDNFTIPQNHTWQIVARIQNKFKGLTFNLNFGWIEWQSKMDLHDNLSVRILRTILLVTIAWKWSNAQLPCHFDDSVNITAGDPEDGDSIRFNNMLYPNGTYAEIDYTITNGTSQPAAAHIRGCPCLIRPCVRLCCPYGSFVSNKSTDENIICEKYDGLYKGIFGNLTDNNHNITINFDDHFAYLDRSFDKNFFAEMFQLSKVKYLFDKLFSLENINIILTTSALNTSDFGTLILIRKSFCISSPITKFHFFQHEIIGNRSWSDFTSKKRNLCGFEANKNEFYNEKNKIRLILSTTRNTVLKFSKPKSATQIQCIRDKANK